MANEEAAWANHSQTQRGSTLSPSIDATFVPLFATFVPLFATFVPLFATHIYTPLCRILPMYKKAVAAKGQSNLIVWGQFQD